MTRFQWCCLELIRLAAITGFFLLVFIWAAILFPERVPQ